MSNTDVSWRWDLVVFRLCNQNPTLSHVKLTSNIDVNPIFIFNQNARLSDIMSNVNLTYIDVWCLAWWDSELVGFVKCEPKSSQLKEPKT